MLTWWNWTSPVRWDSSAVRCGSLPAGAVIRTEQAEIRAEVPQYQEMAERAGVFFFFEDEELPELPFFAVPGLELSARDRDGNWYGRSEALGEGVYCVTPEGTAFRVSEDMGRVFQPPAGGEEVREMWEPAPGLRVYPLQGGGGGTDPADSALRTGPGGTGKGRIGCVSDRWRRPDEGTGPAGHRRIWGLPRWG